MTGNDDDIRRAETPNSPFNSTAWTLVLRARGEGQSGRSALGELFQSYWFPLYAFLRRHGVTPTDAEDTVQSFFVWLLESGVLRRADPDRGRFRSFLLASLQQFQVRQHRSATAAKRRPPGEILSLNSEVGERLYGDDLRDEMTPERLYEYSWAVTVVRRALERLQGESELAGNADRFSALGRLMTGDDDASIQVAGDQLGMTAGAVRIALFRLRQRYGAILRLEVCQTLNSPTDVDDELRHLMSALAGRA